MRFDAARNISNSSCLERLEMFLVERVLAILSLSIKVPVNGEKGASPETLVAEIYFTRQDKTRRRIARRSRRAGTFCAPRTFMVERQFKGGLMRKRFVVVALGAAL